MYEVRRYGPYPLDSGHLFFVVYYADGTKKSVLVHREIVEQRIGRMLTKEEVVHHINNDPSDNSFENLRIMTHAAHTKLHAVERGGPEMVTLTCLYCRKSFTRSARRARDAAAQGKGGPFCGKSCSGKWAMANDPAMRERLVLARGHSFSSEVVHGARPAYRNGCRCDLCRAHNTERCRKDRERARNR